jgi:hypothetical protein
VIPHSALDRILVRLCLARGGMATAVGGAQWAIELPAADTVLMFRDELVIDGDQLEIRCDAPLDLYTPEQAVVVTELHAAIASALPRERIAFASFDDVALFVSGTYEADVHADTGHLEIEPEGEQPTTVKLLRVEGEPWLWIATVFDDADPEWLLRKNFELVQLRFEMTDDGTVYLATSFPVAGLTAQRLVELVEDLHAYHERLGDERAAELAEDDEDDD